MHIEYFILVLITEKLVRTLVVRNTKEDNVEIPIYRYSDQKYRGHPQNFLMEGQTIFHFTFIPISLKYYDYLLLFNLLLFINIIYIGTFCTLIPLDVGPPICTLYSHTLLLLASIQ